MKRRAILAFMLDRPGVLNKVLSLIRRKLYNIDTITVCATNQPGISRMSMTLQEDRQDKMDQMIKQIEKITEVISAKELNREDSFWREVAIVKAELDISHLETLGQTHDFKIIDKQNQNLYIIQIAGTIKDIDSFIADIGNDKLVEIARSGFTAMVK
jgi:acetolactate synthase-1/3 small subunit